MAGVALDAPGSTPAWKPYALAASIVVAAGIAELAMGRVPWCTCGYIKLWHGIVTSSENSQHLSDWYTFSHVLHGLGFYGLLSLGARRLSLVHRFVAATALEAAWEVFENTSFVINRYRAATISLDYYGDSVVNSLFDIVFMMIGFWIARRAPLWGTIAIAIALEMLMAAVIRDNLALNIIMLIHPFDAIKRWQLGG